MWCSEAKSFETPSLRVLDPLCEDFDKFPLIPPMVAARRVHHFAVIACLQLPASQATIGVSVTSEQLAQWTQPEDISAHGIMVYLYFALYIQPLYIHCIYTVYTYPLSQIHVFCKLSPRVAPV